jgi:hydroxymethylglutaryl-CoA synthase
MSGITSIGAYVPIYRLNNEEISKIWGGRSGPGSKAVAGYDEDTITMAVAATQDCLKRHPGQVNGLSLATTTSPYLEKLSAAVIASVVDLPRECQTADYTDSLRAATIALKAAASAVDSGAAENVIVTASDCRLGATQGVLEQLLGDGAAAIMIGSQNVIAAIEGSYSIFSDFTDFWRTSQDTYIRSADGRFIEDNSYLPTMQEAVKGLLAKCKLGPGDISKAVFYAPDTRLQAGLVRRLGIDKTRVQDTLYSQIGNTGTAAPLMMLISALIQAKPGDRILLASYGDGSDAFLFRVTDEIEKFKNQAGPIEGKAKKVAIGYGKYLAWKGLVPVETSTLPERSPMSLMTRWRQRRVISSLYGVRCQKCGTAQISPLGQAIRVCVNCQAKDQFEDYKFSDKRGKIFTFATDQLQATLNPPGVNGVIDFDDGGRLIVELTDYELDKVKVGLPVEMTFRKMYSSRGIHNYFWKARPVAE